MPGTRTELLLEDAAYKKRLYAYDGSDNLIYIGKHEHIDHATDSGGWRIWKYTWAAGNLTMTEGPLVGVWDDRASLGWAA